MAGHQHLARRQQAERFVVGARDQDGEDIAVDVMFGDAFPFRIGTFFHQPHRFRIHCQHLNTDQRCRTFAGGEAADDAHRPAWRVGLFHAHQPADLGPLFARSEQQPHAAGTDIGNLCLDLGWFMAVVFVGLVA